APRARRAPRAAVRRGRRRRGATQVRLDGCRALQRTRHPGRQLRPGRPEPRPRRRRARSRRADRAGRGGSAPMADRRLTLPALVRWRLMPWWGRVLVVYALSRVVTTIVMLCFAVVQARETGSFVPDYFTLATNW